ncbi:MAG: TonB-dependent receptor [Sphingobacteriales bacterium]|nr:MAG: TonB-dependent receptor [Sphingobacteriales bacterium]
MNKKITSFLLILLITKLGFAQTRTLTGQVKNADGNAIAGASIVAQPSGKGTASQADGSFSLNIADGDKILKINYLGYKTISQKLGGTNTLNIVLQPATSTQLGEIVLVGSRSSGRTKLNTTAPVDVFNISKLQLQTPQNDLNQLLQYVSPSFNSNRQSSSDGSEHIDPASMRGLGPDQLLVLINGKRRHTTSMVNYQNTAGNGSVGTDLNAIPASAIERIEVLRDGAAAQYGSDAIAGVLNIVLKKNTDNLFVQATAGQSKLKDGGLAQLNLNYGTGLGKNGGFLNLTAEAYNRNRTTRTQNHDLIIFDQSAIDNYFAYAFADDEAESRKFDDDMLAQKGLTRNDFNFQIGDAKIKNIGTFLNLSLPFKNSKTEFYAFGGYSYRVGEGYGSRRLPSDYEPSSPIFPNGYQPNTTSNISDKSLAFGFKQKLGKWDADLSNTLGNNRFDYLVNNTVNPSLGSLSPTSFKAGGHQFLQNTTNLDFSRKFDALAGLNLAFGTEFRVDNYKIMAGEEASYKNYGLVTAPDGTVTNPSGLNGGSQSFIGFSNVNALNKSRNNISLYTDAELDITTKWLISGAARVESYSDFGTALSGKFATRYKIIKGLNLRAAVSNGFRAPSLHQQYFSYASTDILANGTLGETGFFVNESPVAKALSIPKLKQEKSINYSGGFTAVIGKNFNLSADAYQIDIKDRIVLTGGFGFDAFGDEVPAIQAIINPLGVESARFFSNAINTRTRGIDVVTDYNAKIGNSKFDISLGFNVNQNKITQINTPATLVGQEQIFFSPGDSVLVSRGMPRVKSNLSVNYSYKNFSILLRNVYFGNVNRTGFPYGEEQLFAEKLVTDLSLSYTFKPATFTVGANNLFNVYPDLQKYANSYYGVYKYAPVQMGTLGSFFFARLTVNLPTKM